jgi:hypothetical protein
MDIIYRNGKIEDCTRLAEFVSIASDGVVEFLYGFEMVQHIEMESHELIPHEGGAYLMKCQIN